MSDNPDFPELFELDRFVQDITYDELIHRFENGRTVKDINPRKNKKLTVEEFKEETKESNPQKMSKEELKIHLEKLEEQLEKEYHN
jgi:hypothetical protein